jgi:hypothetical protein
LTDCQNDFESFAGGRACLAASENCRAAFFLDSIRFVLAEDFLLAFLQHFQECVETWSETRELTGIQSDGVGEFFFGEFTSEEP